MARQFLLEAALATSAICRAMVVFSYPSAYIPGSLRPDASVGGFVFVRSPLCRGFSQAWLTLRRIPASATLDGKNGLDEIRQLPVQIKTSTRPIAPKLDVTVSA